jgi:hypothetical protein
VHFGSKGIVNRQVKMGLDRIKEARMGSMDVR